MRANKYPQMLHLYAKLSRLSSGDSSHIVFKDLLGRSICPKYMCSVCNDSVCPDAHTDAIYDASTQEFQETGLEYKALLIICVELFGTKLVWQNERYIEECFLAFSSEHAWTQRKVR